MLMHSSRRTLTIRGKAFYGLQQHIFKKPVKEFTIRRRTTGVTQKFLISTSFRTCRLKLYPCVELTPLKSHGRHMGIWFTLDQQGQKLLFSTL